MKKNGVHPINISRPNAQVVIDDSTETCCRISGKNSLLYTCNKVLMFIRYSFVLCVYSNCSQHPACQWYSSQDLMDWEK